MAMIKAGLVGAAIGAVTLATAIFVAPIAAQAPGAPGDAARGGQGPDARAIGPGTSRDTGSGAAGRGGSSDDVDVTGPRGDVGICQDRLARAAQARLERVQRLVRPTEDQRPAFDDLRMASRKAAEVLRQSCEAERPLTPTARMAAAEKRLETRLQALRILRPAVEAFYRQLSDEQKMRWALNSQPGSGVPAERWQTWRESDRGPETRRFEGWQGHEWRGDRPGQDRGARPRWQDEFGDAEDYVDRWSRRWNDAEREFGDGSRNGPEHWRERWRDWHERLNRDRGNDRESWGRRFRDDGPGSSERGWRDQDRDDGPRRRDERSRSTAPLEQRL